MLRALLIVTMIAAGTCAPAWGQPRAAGRATAPAGRNIAWPAAPRNARYTVGNIVLTMRNAVSGADNEILDRVLIVAVPGHPPFTIDAGQDNAYDPQVMVVPTRDRSPLVLFQTFSGGAHCCTTINAIVPHQGRLQAVTVYQGDGGPMEEAPRDIDGDGRIDFVRYDNAFLYAFASYAESFAPSTIVNVIDGNAVDVSDGRGFRSLFEEDARRARETCAAGESGRNGACAAYVAASARIGRFEDAWVDMLRHYDREATWEWPTGCRVTPGDAGCPDNQVVIHPDFPAALRAFLAEHGYIDR